MQKALAILLTVLCTLPSLLLDAQVSKEASIERNVIYGMHGGLALLMDVYRPAQPNGRGIIVIPGSGFHQLMSYDATPLNKNAWYLSNIIGTDNLLDHGYTLFVVNHRSSPVFRFPAAVEDVQRAVQFIRHHAEDYHIDKDGLGAIGHSSGAHLASMLGTLEDIADPDAETPIGREGSKVQAVVALAGLFDLTAFAKSGFGDIGAIASFVGTHLPVWRNPDAPRDHEFALYAKASPIKHLSEDDASFLLVHGTHEKVVHVDQSKMFHAKLLEHNIGAKLLVLENADHGLRIDGTVAAERYYPATIQLFDRVLRGR